MRYELTDLRLFMAIAQARNLSSGASAVQHTLGLPNTAFRYLTSHGALDQDHMKFFERLMNRVEDPADQAAIVAMARDIFRLFGGVFSAIELEGSRHAA